MIYQRFLREEALRMCGGKCVGLHAFLYNLPKIHRTDLGFILHKLAQADYNIFHKLENLNF